MSPFMALNETDAHEAKVKINDIKLLQQLWPFVKTQWRGVLLSVILLPVLTYLQVQLPRLVQTAIDGPIRQNNLEALGPYIITFTGFLAGLYLLRYWQMTLAQITGQAIVLQLRTKLYNHIQTLSSAYFHKTPTGVLVTRLTTDIENISELFASGGLAILADFALILGIVISMTIMSPQLSVVIWVILPIMAFMMEWFRKKSRLAYNQLRVLMAQLNSFLQETFTGISVIQLFQKEKAQTQKFNQINADLTQANMVSITYDSAFTASVEFMAYGTIIAVLAVFAVWHAKTPEMVTIGVFIAFIQYTQMLFEPIEELSDKFTTIQSGLASLEKINQIFSKSPQITSPQNPIKNTATSGKLAFKNVDFSYHPDQLILQNISLTIEAGQKVAIIGATGAGKSTLIKLLNRQYDVNSGEIELDGIPIQQYALADLRQKIIPIPQDDFIFSRTVLENIMLAYPVENQPEKISAILNALHANALIDNLPQGIDTLLAERGRTLSNGERQLLIFARALYHNPAVLILDEATASIDPQTEQIIQEALETMLAGRTAIIVAHRLSTIQNADLVVVLEAGQVVEIGLPEALRQKNGAYVRYLNQFLSTPAHVTNSVT